MDRNELLAEKLKAAFADVETISLDAADKLGKLLDKAPLDALVLLVKKKVKFCAGVARNRLRLKYGWEWGRIAALNKAE